MTELPTDLIKARELLEELIRSKNHRTWIDLFKDATELLAGYADDDSNEGRFARQIQKTYVRKFLEELPSPSDLEIGEWLFYFFVLSEMEPSAESLRAEYPDLYENYNSFLSSELLTYPSKS